MDCISSVTGSNGCSLNSSLKGSELPELFSKLGLGKYTDVFQQQEVVWIRSSVTSPLTVETTVDEQSSSVLWILPHAAGCQDIHVGNS